MDASLAEGRLKLSSQGNLHLTLKFIGSFPAERLDDLSSVLRGVSVRHSPIRIQPSGIGGFPSKEKARIVWAGVDARSFAPLRDLARDIEASLKALGVEADKSAYTPHFTLGRSRSGGLSLAHLKFEKSEFPAFEADAFTLACNPNPGSARVGGPVYERVEEFPLGEVRES